MNLSTFLFDLGFRRQNLGVNLAYAGKFFQFCGETYVFDEDGIPWIKKGLLDPGDYFDQVHDPVLWEVSCV